MIKSWRHRTWEMPHGQAWLIIFLRLSSLKALVLLFFVLKISSNLSFYLRKETVYVKGNGSKRTNLICRWAIVS